jgi:hypothetical protein
MIALVPRLGVEALHVRGLRMPRIAKQKGAKMVLFRLKAPRITRRHKKAITHKHSPVAKPKLEK